MSAESEPHKTVPLEENAVNSESTELIQEPVEAEIKPEIGEVEATTPKDQASTEPMEPSPEVHEEGSDAVKTGETLAPDVKDPAPESEEAKSHEENPTEHASVQVNGQENTELSTDQKSLSDSNEAHKEGERSDSKHDENPTEPEDPKEHEQEDNKADHEEKIQQFMLNEEEVKHFSDDEISIQGSSSDSESDSSSDSSSSSSSDSSDLELEGEEDDIQIDDLDEEDEASGGPIVSKNEIDEKAYSLPEGYKVPENAPLEFVGNLTGVFERNAIVKANVSGEFRVLKDQSVLCFEDKLVLGPLFETFGKLQAPHYRVKFNNEEYFEAVKSRKGEKVFYVVPESQFIYTDAIKKLKGTDASNCHDEELPEDEQEFSDDEQELAAKQRKKKKKKAKDSNGGPQVKKQHTNPEPNKFTSYGFAPNQTTYAGLPRVPPRGNNQYDRSAPVQSSSAQPQQPPQTQQPNQAYGSPNPYGAPIANQPQFAPNPYPSPYHQQVPMPQVQQYQQPQNPYGYGQPYWPQGPPQAPPQMYPQQPYYQQPLPQQMSPNYQVQPTLLPQPPPQQAQQQTNALHQLHALVANQLNQQDQNQHTQHPPQGPPQ